MTGKRELTAMGLALIAGCSESNQNSVSPADTPSERGIIHGVSIKSSVHPETVKVFVGRGFCTAVFVRKNPPTLLTASHCLKDLPSQSANDGGIVYQSTRSRRACVPEGAIAQVGADDIAVVVFVAGSIKVPGVAALTKTDPKEGMSVTLVGFGRNDARPGVLNNGAGQKRLGLNTITAVINGSGPIGGMLGLVGAVVGDLPLDVVQSDQDSSPSQGDSGGPLFLNLPGGQEVVGLVSGGRVIGGAVNALYTNLRAESNRRFLAAALDASFLKRLAGVQTPNDYTEICNLK